MTSNRSMTQTKQMKRRGGARLCASLLVSALGVVVPALGQPADPETRSPETASPAAEADQPTLLAPARSALEAREELQQLLDGSLLIAARQLQNAGTFFPFLAGLTDSGQIQIVGMPASEQRPDLDVMLQALRKAARQLTRQERFRAVALYVDFVGVRKDTQLEQPGIRVELEHVFPDSLTVFVPYLIGDKQQIRLMTPQFMPGHHPYFFQPRD